MIGEREMEREETIPNNDSKKIRYSVIVVHIPSSSTPALSLHPL